MRPGLLQCISGVALVGIGVGIAGGSAIAGLVAGVGAAMIVSGLVTRSNSFLDPQ